MTPDFTPTFVAFALTALVVVWIRYKMHLHQMKWHRRMMWAEIREGQESRND